MFQCSIQLSSISIAPRASRHERKYPWYAERYKCCNRQLNLPLIHRRSLAFRRALADPQVIESLLTQGMPALHTSAQDFNIMIKSDYAKWSGIIKAANIKPE